MTRKEFLFQTVRGKTMLDIGNLADDGAIHKELLSRKPEIDLYGLDVVDQTSVGLHFSNQFIGNAEQIPLEDDFFDCLYIGEVFEHTWKPGKVLMECNRVLKKNGLMILDTPNVYSLSRILKYLITGKDHILGNPDHKIFFSRAMMENALTVFGFTVVNITTDRKVTIKGLSMTLPSYGSLNFLGEHIMLTARKK